MPIYTFRCEHCNTTREAISSFATANELVFICVACGGDMTRASVTSVNIIGPAIIARKVEKQQEERAYFAKACGHNYACRCGVKFSKPNPFKQRIRAAHGFNDEE